ncbi:hypothetical protein J3S90_04335 [Flavobacterium sp. P4023]|uniref:Uncharacterized protein n=1 Tax=Flavobacterium flabelliforme TaxID=2816119 RepID=A0ABS5CQY1_9FLAO|nr:hypothetical protein [Flavobacterium flabelliforme]MBP4141023.1 hypothetical protein [Flavobacterium flabelliforme]
MKPQSITSKENLVSSFFIFLTSMGLCFSLVNHFILQKANFSLLIIMSCLFVISLASWQRKKWSK